MVMEHEAMIRKGAILTCAAVLTLVAAGCAGSDDEVRVTAEGAEPTPDSTAPSSAETPMPEVSVASEEQSDCVSGAASAYVPENERQAELLREFAPAHEAADASAKVDAAEAIVIAEQTTSRDASKPLTEASSAVELSYADLLATGQVAFDERINAERCFWLVTVHGSFTPRPGPTGEPREPFDVYNLVVDEASGVGIQVIAGVDLSK